MAFSPKNAPLERFAAARLGSKFPAGGRGIPTAGTVRSVRRETAISAPAALLQGDEFEVGDAGKGAGDGENQDGRACQQV